VFVVDDESEVRAFLCETLEHAGYRTRAFESGTDALRLAPLERPLLMLLDIYLPDLDGYTVASRIRDLPATARTSIIFISGADAYVHQTLSHGLGAIYLQKPIIASQLVRATCRRRGARRVAHHLPRSDLAIATASLEHEHPGRLDTCPRQGARCGCRGQRCCRPSAAIPPPEPEPPDPTCTRCSKPVRPGTASQYAGGPSTSAVSLRRRS
jgi:CheY-like chemotaxis protein